MIPKLIDEAGSKIYRGNRPLHFGLYECPICKSNFEAAHTDINTLRKRNCGCVTAYKDEELPAEINGYKLIKDLRTVKGRRTAIFLCPACGVNEITALVTNVKANKAKKHCGCVVVEPKVKENKPKKIINPKYKHPLYFTWDNMIARCYRKTCPKYKHYGARGISVCDAWRNDFWQFVKDMGDKPTPLHSIDRIDNNGHYTHTNCRWATQLTQQNNRRNNRTA